MLSITAIPGGGERVRTDGLLRARQALSQLSYTPNMVGLGGLEPPTSRLSVVCSSQLSYRPKVIADHFPRSFLSESKNVLAEHVSRPFGLSKLNSRLATGKRY